MAVFEHSQRCVSVDAISVVHYELDGSVPPMASGICVVCCCEQQTSCCCLTRVEDLVVALQRWTVTLDAHGHGLLFLFFAPVDADIENVAECCCICCSQENQISYAGRRLIRKGHPVFAGSSLVEGQLLLFGPTRIAVLTSATACTCKGSIDAVEAVCFAALALRRRRLGFIIDIYMDLDRSDFGERLALTQTRLATQRISCIYRSSVPLAAVLRSSTRASWHWGKSIPGKVPTIRSDGSSMIYTQAWPV